MKKFFCLVAMLTLLSISANAAKANGIPRAVKQPDGTTIMVRLLGDEHQHWYQTMDGVMLYNDGSAYYVAQIAPDGTLNSTGILAHNIDKRNDVEIQAVKSQNKSYFFSVADSGQKELKKASGYPVANRCPHSGKVRVPIFLMEYADKSFVHQGDELIAEFEEYFNGTETSRYSVNTRSYGYGSVRQYFLDASNGKLDFEFVLYGPYKISLNHDQVTKNDQYGYTALYEVIAMAAQSGEDFSSFDSNNDGQIDLLYVLFAGTGQNISNDNTDIWPYCSFGYKGMLSGKEVRVAGMSNELTPDYFNGGKLIRAGIGVLCHEMSHGLGLPDLYWSTTNKDYFNNCGPEDWDLMDGGENIAASIWPCQYSAWEKEDMGWIDPIHVITEPQQVKVYPFDYEGNTDDGFLGACKVVNPANPNEYYVIENFTTNGWNEYLWVRYLKMNEPAGLIITHINGYSSTATSSVPNKNHGGQPRITLLPADGEIYGSYNYSLATTQAQYNTEVAIFRNSEACDPYPGNGNVTEITDYRNYTKPVTGKDMGELYPITDIKVNDDSSITFWFRKADILSTSIDGIENADYSNNRIFTLDGRYMGNDLQTLPNGIYVKDGKKVVKK